MSLPLLPGRGCGGCVECCRHIPLDVPELAKPTGTLCVHCVPDRGCGVHDVRPQTCRTWFCVWRMVALDDDWRPDRSGVIVRPDGLQTGEMTLYVVRPTDWLERPEVAQVLASWIEQGLGLAISLPGPVGTLPVRAVVTDYLGPALLQGDHPTFVRRLRRTLDSLAAHDFEPDGIEPRHLPLPSGS